MLLVYCGGRTSEEDQEQPDRGGAENELSLPPGAESFCRRLDEEECLYRSVDACLLYWGSYEWCRREQEALLRCGNAGSYTCWEGTVLRYTTDECVEAQTVLSECEQGP